MSSTIRRHLSLSRGELVVAALVVFLLAGAAGFRLGANEFKRQAARFAEISGSDADVLKSLNAVYGPGHNSSGPEEWIVRDFFRDERGGVFVDVGANHHQVASNTYYLETQLGWSGVALEPQPKFASGYKEFRPKTVFVPLFVSDVSNRQATLYVTEYDQAASSSKDFTEVYGAVTETTTTTTTTLDDVLERLSITRIDFLSMDIELAEPQALAGFSIARFRPRLVAVEAHLPVRQQVLDYFTRHQYSLVGKYWRIDSENFWFAPAAP